MSLVTGPAFLGVRPKPHGITCTESSDTITVGSVAGIVVVTVKSETGTADDLATVNGTRANQIIILKPYTGHTITVKTGGNLKATAVGGVIKALDAYDTLTFISDGTYLSEQSRGDNPS